MKVVCNYNDPFNLPEAVPNDFSYGLEVGKEYIVMGVVLYNDSHCLYYLIDVDGRPDWFPSLLFTISVNLLPSIWFIKLNPEKKGTSISCLWGFDELCNNPTFYHLLIERDEEAMRIYFRRKIEREKEYETYF